MRAERWTTTQGVGDGVFGILLLGCAVWLASDPQLELLHRAFAAGSLTVVGMFLLVFRS
jgi:hypothetical protein